MGRRYALIIGNSDYQDASLARLLKPAQDVEGLAAVLRDPEIGAFDEVLPLVDQPENKVRREIGRFCTGKRRDDLLLLYFSGHGVLDDQGQLHLAVHDTERNYLSSTAVAASFIKGELDKSFSNRQIVILDCCHSGAFGRGSKGVEGASVGTKTAFETRGKGRVVLTASDATQYAWEGDQIDGHAERSLFTHYLIQGLHTGAADMDGDGQISHDELYYFVHGRVIEVTPKQTPLMWADGLEGKFVIARNQAPLTPVALPDEVRGLVESPMPSSRRDAVRELERLLHSGHRGRALAARTALEGLAANDDSTQVRSAAAAALAAAGVSPAAATELAPAATPTPTPPQERQASPSVERPSVTPPSPVGSSSSRRARARAGSVAAVAGLSVIVLALLWTRVLPLPGLGPAASPTGAPSVAPPSNPSPTPAGNLNPTPTPMPGGAPTSRPLIIPTFSIIPSSPTAGFLFARSPTPAPSVAPTVAPSRAASTPSPSLATPTLSPSLATPTLSPSPATPTPGATPRPAPTPTPAVSPTTTLAAGWQPARTRRDDFGDAARGSLPWGSGSAGQGAYVQGEYDLVLFNPPGDFVSATLEPIYADASIAIDARFANDPTGRVIGLGCRNTPANDFYSLGVAPADGQFTIVRSDKGLFTNIVAWQASPAIRRGGVNRLELHCVGTTILAIINGTIVASIQDDAYSQGRMWIGVAMRGDLRGSAQARFDHLEIVEFEFYKSP